MYLFLAFFWLAVGIVTQIYWDTLQAHAFIPVPRMVFGFILFVLFSYNMVRWRMARMMRQQREDTTELPPRPKVIHREYDPTFDFSRPESNEEPKKDPPAPGAS